MHVCVNVCMFVCMYIYVCIYICTFVCMYVCIMYMSVCLHVCICEYVHICVYKGDGDYDIVLHYIVKGFINLICCLLGELDSLLQAGLITNAK